jgi:GntR family transcriptional regulator
VVSRTPPLSERVRSIILQWIRESRWGRTDGSLPSEAEIAEQLQVSRTTVREALSRLERDRIIIRRHGSGTYVNPALKGIQTTLETLLSPEEIIVQQQFRASIAFQKITRIEADGLAGDQLNTEPGKPAVSIEGLYLADTRPAIWLEGITPILRPELGADFPTIDQGLDKILFHTTGQVVAYSLTSLDAVTANQIQAEHLLVEPGVSLVCLVDLHMADSGQPVFYSRTYYAPDVIDLTMVRNKQIVPEHISIW